MQPQPKLTFRVANDQDDPIPFAVPPRPAAISYHDAMPAAAESTIQHSTTRAPRATSSAPRPARVVHADEGNESNSELPLYREPGQTVLHIEKPKSSTRNSVTTPDKQKVGI